MSERIGFIGLVFQEAVAEERRQSELSDRPRRFLQRERHFQAGDPRLLYSLLNMLTGDITAHDHSQGMDENDG